MITLDINGFKGRPSACFHYFYTATGVRIVLSGELAKAIQALIEKEKK